MAPLIQITADEVNQIIYAYLQDSGFLHTAFALRVEGRLEQSKHFNEYIPRGELVELLTKALLYTEVETHCKGDGLITDCKAPFSLLKRHECAVDLMDDAVSGAADKVGKLSVSNGVVEPPLKRKASIPAEGDIQSRRVKRSLEPESVMDTNTGPSRNSPASAVEERISSERDASPMSIAPSAVQFNAARPRSKSKTLLEGGPGYIRTPSKAIVMLAGHSSEVFVSAWNPAYPGILATGAKDATARIWELPDPPDDPYQFAGPPEKPPIVLRHMPDTEQKDVTSVDWSADGSLLATGSFDSILRIWTRTGEFYMSHPQHQKGPIFSARFSSSGKWLLSCSLDGTACVWDVKGKKLHMQFRCHDECCLDAVWFDEEVFATCGADKVIKVMRIGDQNPLLTLQGHENEVNSIRFNPSKTRLASCSDDKTVRIWEIARYLDDPQCENISAMVLEGHSDSIASINWCPSRPEGSPEIIATAAFDGSAYLWNATTGECLHMIHDHKRAAYSLTFSPDGKFLATGSGDGWLYVYNVESGKQVWSWYGGSEKTGIYEVNWQQTGKLNRMVLCLETGSVAIIDVTRIPALTEVK
ncbi:hypothetical protein ACEPAF_4106 [Sanghuangporus sanghuang]